MIKSIRKVATKLLYPIAKRVVKKKEGVWHHRKIASIILQGTGIEIGALHNPQKLSSNAIVEYVDLFTKEEAISNYPELNPDDIVEVKFKTNLNKDGLKNIETESKDFVVLSHVIEHVANPIYILEECFRVLKLGGYFVIACPDKNYTFDKGRSITEFEHLVNDYNNKIDYIEDLHLIENIQYFKPKTNFNNEELLTKEKKYFSNGNAHIHVWDSISFLNFLIQSMTMLNLNYSIIYKNTGEDNGHEFFAIIKKI